VKLPAGGGTPAQPTKFLFRGPWAGCFILPKFFINP